MGTPRAQTGLLLIGFSGCTFGSGGGVGAGAESGGVASSTTMASSLSMSGLGSVGTVGSGVDGDASSGGGVTGGEDTGEEETSGVQTDGAETGTSEGGSTGGCPGRGTVYDAFAQTSFDDNPTPSGVWRYGATAGFGGSLTLFTESIVEMGLQAWKHPGITDPNVVKNPTGVLIQHSTAPIDFPAEDYLHVHPGPSDEPCLLRWTAPAAGTYLVQADFISLNTTGATTGVHVVHNADVLVTDVIMNPAAMVSYAELHELAADDVVDFIVTDGGNGYVSDSTGVRATLTLMCGDGG